jgi:hypothetical protein
MFKRREEDIFKTFCDFFFADKKIRLRLKSSEIFFFSSKDNTYVVEEVKFQKAHIHQSFPQHFKAILIDEAFANHYTIKRILFFLII